MAQGLDHRRLVVARPDLRRRRPQGATGAGVRELVDDLSDNEDRGDGRRTMAQGLPGDRRQPPAGDRRPVRRRRDRHREDLLARGRAPRRQGRATGKSGRSAGCCLQHRYRPVRAVHPSGDPLGHGARARVGGSTLGRPAVPDQCHAPSPPCPSRGSTWTRTSSTASSSPSTRRPGSSCARGCCSAARWWWESRLSERACERTRRATRSLEPSYPRDTRGEGEESALPARPLWTMPGNVFSTRPLAPRNVPGEFQPLRGCGRSFNQVLRPGPTTGGYPSGTTGPRATTSRSWATARACFSSSSRRALQPSRAGPLPADLFAADPFVRRDGRGRRGRTRGCSRR